MIKLSFLL